MGALGALLSQMFPMAAKYMWNSIVPLSVRTRNFSWEVRGLESRLEPCDALHEVRNSIGLERGAADVLAGIYYGRLVINDKDAHMCVGVKVFSVHIHSVLRRAVRTSSWLTHLLGVMPHQAVVSFNETRGVLDLGSA